MAIVNDITGVKQDRSIYNGASWIHSFRLKDFTGAYMDCRNLSVIKASIRSKRTDSVDLFSATVGQGLTISGEDFSQVDLSKVVTIPKPGDVYYDITATLSDGTIVTIEYGVMKVI